LAKKKRGRPPRGEYPEKSAVMNFRIRPDTKRLLTQAARASGRTLSAETEHQLRRAVAEMGAGRTYVILTAIGRAIDGLVELKRTTPGTDWWSDPDLYTQARRVVLTALDLFKPPGTVTDAGPDDTRTAEFAIETTLREIQLFDETKPFVKQTPYERWLGMMKKDLGPLADRLAVWGVPAARARENQERFRPFRDELIALSRKAARAPDAMLPDEHRRLKELWDEVAKIRE
jgi:hypothetical protein